MSLADKDTIAIDMLVGDWLTEKDGTRKMFLHSGGAMKMTETGAHRAPFSWMRVENYHPVNGSADFKEKASQRDRWLADNFVFVIIDRHGRPSRLLRGGIDPEKMINDMNYEAAALIMAEGTKAADLLELHKL